MERVITYLIGKKKKKNKSNQQPGNTSVTKATIQQNGVKKSKNRTKLWKKKRKQTKQQQKTAQSSPDQNVKEQPSSTMSTTRTVSVTPNNVTVSIGRNVSQKSQGGKKDAGKKNWRVVKWGRREKMKPDASTPQTTPQPNVPKKGEDFSSNWKKLAAALQTHKETQVSTKTSLQPAKKRKSDQKESPRKRTKLRREDKGGGASQEQSSHPDLWFVDDVNVEDIEVTLGSEVAAAARKERGMAHRPALTLVKPDSFDGLTRAVGMDCEMVGTGHRGSKSALARVSIVMCFCLCLFVVCVPVDPSCRHGLLTGAVGMDCEMVGTGHRGS
ncbi:RNA exonuclease 4-like [Branchiostoma lanceolatum]|uniref:RNA exonuclease 4-like n=1 Tax=Branchiostoma lanceolatum TaxID=7740 RepID=UPI003453B2C1